MRERRPMFACAGRVDRALRRSCLNAASLPMGWWAAGRGRRTRRYCRRGYGLVPAPRWAAAGSIHANGLLRFRFGRA